jgi:hypothetical protein
MTAKSAAKLEAHLSRWQIEFIVHDQHFLRLDAIKPRQRANSLAGPIHESLRQQQPELVGA